MRLEFYQAVNKANLYQPKPKAKKKLVKETLSIEDQIANLLKDGVFPAPPTDWPAVPWPIY